MLEQNNFCNCRCGGIAKPGRRFIWGHNGRGRVPTEQERSKASLAKLGAKNPMFGKYHLEATKQLQALKHKGKKYNVTEDGRKALQENARLQAINYPEVRIKFSKSQLGKKQSAELIEKRIAPLRGKKRPLVIGRKISATKLLSENNKKIRDAFKKPGYSNSGQYKIGRLSLTKGQTKENNSILAKISNIEKEQYLHGREVVLVSPGFYASDLGHRVRSMWEANFARLLKFLGLDYEYEKYRFKLSNNTVYIPDFYIPIIASFIEIKGNWKGKPKINKTEIFIADGLGKMFLVDEKEYGKIDLVFKKIVPNWNWKPNV